MNEESQIDLCDIYQIVNGKNAHIDVILKKCY